MTALEQELREQLERSRAECMGWKRRSIVLAADNDELKRCISRGAVPGWTINKSGRLVSVHGNTEKEAAEL